MRAARLHAFTVLFSVTEIQKIRKGNYHAEKAGNKNERNGLSPFIREVVVGGGRNYEASGSD